jgi:hypothetical protein
MNLGRGCRERSDNNRKHRGCLQHDFSRPLPGPDFPNEGDIKIATEKLGIAINADIKTGYNLSYNQCPEMLIFESEMELETTNRFRNAVGKPGHWP